MKFSNAIRLSALAGALSMAAGTQAADPEKLATIGSSGAVFAAGATINGGASFQSRIPDGQTLALKGTITPASGDIGKEGDILVVAKVGSSFYQHTAGGWKSLKLDITSTDLGITPFATLTLGDPISYSEDDLGTALGQDLSGKKVRVVWGYAPAGGSIRYHKTLKVDVANPPATNVCPDGSTPKTVTLGQKNVCTLSGTYEEDLILTNNFDYVLSGAVRIGNDNTADVSLTIDPGVTTYGQSGNDFLWIDRGAKIFANGTASEPITMTSANDADATATTRGEWGGLVINGNAVINGCSTPPCESAGEGNSGMYGGSDDTDSSGSLTYLRVKYPGFLINDLDELNGIAFQGTGSGTIVDYVQVHNSQDDGIEFFGGTTNAKHIYITGSRDDSLDWTKGWRGNAQHVIVVQGSDTGDQGFEMDNNGSAPDSTPRAQPRIANATVIGNANTDIGLLIREGTGANFHNLIVKGFADGCIDIDQTETFTAAGTPDSLTGVMTMDHSIVECETNFIEESGDPWTVKAWFDAGTGNVELETGMSDYINSDAVNELDAVDPSTVDTWFDSVDHRGAVKSSADDWTKGWTFSPL
ncbi:MAG: hypothetical protein ACO2YY_04380 [Pseudohongiellaceae bacterium]